MIVQQSNNAFLYGGIKLWKFHNGDSFHLISILYHIITKTAIPLYQNCGFYLAEMESQGSKGCAFLHPTRKHSRLRSFTRSLRILLVFSQSRSEISLFALYEFMAQWTVATAHKKQAVSPEPTKSWLSDENKLTSDEQSSICHRFGNCVFMTHKIIITMPNIWPRISSIDV